VGTCPHKRQQTASTCCLVTSRGSVFPERAYQALTICLQQFQAIDPPPAPSPFSRATKTTDGAPLPRVLARDPTHSLPLCAGAGGVPGPTSDQLFLKMMDKGPIRSREHSALQPQYASIHFERRLHNPESFFTQNITLLPHLFVHAIPIAQPSRSSLLQIAVSTMLRAGLDALATVCCRSTVDTAP